MSKVCILLVLITYVYQKTRSKKREIFNSDSRKFNMQSSMWIQFRKEYCLHLHLS